MNLAEWIDHNAGLAPDKAAIRFPGREVSYAGLAALVDSFAAALAGSGVKRGSCAAYLGYNSPEMLALLFACARLGALFMPLNWRLAAPEHRQMLEDCPPAVLFVEAPFIAQTETLRPELGGVMLVSMGAEQAGWTGCDDFLTSANTSAPRDTGVDAQAPLLICYTSGSTGKPKGVLLTQDALLWNAANSADMHDLTADDIILTTLPLFHVGGLNNQTTPALAAGCSVVLHPKFDVDATFDAIERERITLAVLVPAQLDMMMASPRWQSADLSSLRMITSGSTIVPERLIRAVHEKGVPLIQVYGSTETCPIAAYIKVKDAERKAGSAGKPARHCRLRIADDLGKDVPQGTTGEILVQGHNVMAGYWNAPEATAAVLQNGWFHTGDMGHLDAEGYLYVDGRRKEMIISGGENIYPAEIENVLLESPDIAEASVVGRADARWGEIVVAVVAPKDGCSLSAEQVLRLLEGRIARYKHPKEVVFVGQLPKTALGKIRKDDVRRMVAHEAAA
ncbi:MAG: o-succinylbenzoate--CoA ligase [Rhodocyclaceae bacterium]|nr:o-succinylbenzoate--CoA ligase [Rhodocyclaceae bacterium]MCP5296530.1 o-succinylbenzoate--CoA ligase [Zoogloeaceae bacterium]MCW5595119.1 o-succinylbenzoate--CoA ligase [Rhodocyclaceae bacterium]